LTDSVDIPFRPIAAPLPALRPPSSLGSLAALVRAYPKIAVGAAILLLMLTLAIFAPLLGASDPRALSVGERLRPPSAEHWFGTDQMGRDLYSRVLYGARISMAVGFFAALFSSVAGGALGLVAACDRRLDTAVMRVLDGLMSIPAILLAIALMAVAGGSVQNVILAVTVVETPRVARMVRGVLLSLREQPFVEAAIASGSSGFKIVIRHLLPGILGPLTVQATFVWGASILIEAALSFIGAGTPPTIPSWGNIMADGKALWQVKPELIFAPAAFVSLTVLGVNLLGDGLRRAIDPRATGRRL
jgi:peptide/nickel transport system permease protein